MKELFEVSNYTELQREIEALRKRIEDLESGRIHPKGAGRATCWRRLVRSPALALPAVIVVVVLTLAALGATDQQDPLFIDQNGNVGINQTKPESLLDVNGNALFRGLLSFHNGLFVFDSADGTASVAKNAYRDSAGWHIKDPTKKAFTLEIRNSGMLELYGTTTAGQANWVMMASFDAANNKIAFPSGAPLEVTGEIRGKPWISMEYEWNTNMGPPTLMTKSDRSICFLTFVSGAFSGEGEGVQVRKEHSYWELSGLGTNKTFVRAKARCIGAP